MSKASLDLAFWPSMVRTHPFETHVEVASAAGFTSLAVLPQTYAETLARGISAADMRKRAEDAGVPLRHLDTVSGWAPIRYPADAKPGLRYRFDWSAEYCLGMAEALGLTSMVAVAGYETGQVDEATQLECFRSFCKRAEDIGVRVDLEFLAFFAINDLGAAWRLVEASGAKNAAVMVDTWHTLKLGTDLSALDAIPAGKIANVQIADGWRSQRGESTLYDAAHYREFPGDGDLPINEVLDRLARKGGIVSIGLEVFSDAVDRMSPVDTARRSAETTHAALLAAGLASDERPLPLKIRDV